MDNTLSLAKSYLAAEGWNVETHDRDLLRGDRTSKRGDDEKDYIYVWVAQNVAGTFSAREGSYLGRFEEARVAHPTAEKVLLLPTLKGLSNDFRSGALRWYAVKIVVPAQFFDDDFRWERDKRAASATSELRRRGEDVAVKRVAQPFRLIKFPGSTDDSTGPDLLPKLREELRSVPNNDDRPTIHIVVGSAGMGKSFLFDSLYAHLYNDFQSDKRSRQLSARPFALLPEHINNGTSSTIGSVLDGYLQTELTRPMGRDMFNWKLTHGLGIWLLDGLDEILERDRQFFDDLEDLINTRSGSAHPSIVICIRDSLLETHRGLKDFCEGDSGNCVQVYQLKGWQQPSKVEFAQIRIQPISKAMEFVHRLTDRPALDSLASTPYYCDLLTEEFTNGGLRSGNSETDILERGIKRIIARERGKKLLQDISDDGIHEFIESCATIDLFDGGISTEEVHQFAAVIIAESIEDDEQEQNRLVTQLGQIAIFTNGYDGRLRIAQEPLQHYLAARHLAQNLLRETQGSLRQDALGSYRLPDNVIRLMLDCISPDQYGSVWELLIRKIRQDYIAERESITGSNALRLAIRMSADNNGLARIHLAGLNLSGIRFTTHDVRGISFDGADLTNTDFRKANLTGSSFDNCLIKGTIFGTDDKMLSSIRFGELHRFYSAYVGDTFVDDAADFIEVIGKKYSDEEHIQPACAAARQLRHLFGKFVEETGRGRRKDLPERALRRGKRIVQNRDDILSEAIRLGYLVEGTFRDRIGRAQDDSYGEIVRFRTHLQMSPRIQELLDNTCREADCPHVF